ncbi:MAG: signal recognition particle receptor subunit alpha, partial [Bacteroidota bacterium]
MGFFSKFKEKISKQVEKAGENFNKAVKDTGEAFRFKKVREGLEKTRKSFVENIQAVLGAGRKIDDQLLEEIEEILLTADIGVVTSEQLIENLKKRVRKEGLEKGEDVYSILKDEMHEM